MNYINFSKSYHVRMLTERDIPLILALCEKNTQFYEHCPPFVTAESIRDDMCALPQRKMDEPQDKYYLGFFDDAEQLVAVMDFIDHYPTEQSCFIGFFMMERSVQGHGIGIRVLSGGERQALAIGRAMYFGARLVILDEPTTAQIGRAHV